MSPTSATRIEHGAVHQHRVLFQVSIDAGDIDCITNWHEENEIEPSGSPQEFLEDYVLNQLISNSEWDRIPICIQVIEGNGEVVS